MSEYQPEPGTWRLISPSGIEYEADSPMRCVRAWTNANVPATVQLQRIRAMCAPTLEDKAELDAHLMCVKEYAEAMAAWKFTTFVPDSVVDARLVAVRASALALMGLSE